ncbi:PD-(D/E)XK nuclease family protein [Paenibacillus thiaminolyticus]|nr:PD-(D/E)XK nuclease family protein [Paenibacillus thiaminolyticus]
MEVLTHTRLQTRKNCPKMDYWRNIRGLVPTRKKQSLNIGGAFHIGMETRSVEKAVTYMRNSSVPAIQEEAEELELAAAIVEGMVTGALQRWPRLGVENYPEQKFEVPIFNPATGSASKSFRLGGKTDELLRLEDGTWWIMEYKTASQIGQAYIERLDLDSQITTYIHGLQLKYPEIVISGVFTALRKAVYPADEKGDIRRVPAARDPRLPGAPGLLLFRTAALSVAKGSAGVSRGAMGIHPGIPLRQTDRHPLQKYEPLHRIRPLPLYRLVSGRRGSRAYVPDRRTKRGIIG